MKVSVFVILMLIQVSLFAQEDSITSSLPVIQIKSIRTSEKNNTTKTKINLKKTKQLQLGQDAPYVLQSVPSLTFSSDAGNGIGYTSLSLRGMDAERIQININGIPYNDAESHQVYWVNINDLLRSGKDIEIQRGVGFSTMGGTGLGASVSISTLQKYKEPFVQLSTSFGSFNTLTNSIEATTGVLDDGWQVYGRISKQNSDGFIDRASSDLRSVYASISKYGNKFSTHLVATSGMEKTYQAWYGVSQEDYENGDITKNIAGTEYGYKEGEPYENQVDDYDQHHFQWINSLYWNEDHSSSFSAYASLGHGFYEEYKVGESFSDYFSELSRSGDLIRRLQLDNQLIGFNASHIMEFANIQNTSAISFNTYDGDHFGRVIHMDGVSSENHSGNFYFNNAKKSDLTLFNKFNIKYKKSNFTLDLQIRNVNYEGQGKGRKVANINFDRNFTFFNPKIAWNTTLNSKNRLYTFFGISHREPNRDDIVNEDKVHTPNPERAYNLELGYKHLKKDLALTANLWGMYFQDQLIPTGALNSVGASIRENVESSYRAGAEFELKYNVNSKITLITNQYFALHKILDYNQVVPVYNADYSLNSTQKIDYGTTDIAMAPNWVSYGEIQFSPLKNSSISLINKIVSKQYLDNTSSDAKSIPLYSIFNLSASHDFNIKGLKALSLYGLLNNVFDVKYVTRGYTYNSGATIQTDGSIMNGTDFNYYYPQAGINFLMGVRVRM